MLSDGAARRRSVALRTFLALLVVAASLPLSVLSGTAGAVPALAVSTDRVPITFGTTPAAVQGGDTFTVDLLVGADTRPVDAVDAHVDFNPAKLQVVDSNGNATTCLTSGTACLSGTTAGHPLPVVLLNSVDNATGHLSISRGRETTGVPADALFTLATVRFKAVGPSPGTSLRFATAAPRVTDAFFQSSAVGIAGPGSTIGVRGVQLGLTPATSAVAAGEVFTLDITADAGPQAVDAIDAFLNFDPATLRVVDAAGNAANCLTDENGCLSGTTAGHPLPEVVLNSVDNTTGQIAFRRGKEAAGTPASGAFTLATVRFKAIGPTLESTIAFNRETPRATTAVAGGNPVLGPFLSLAPPAPGDDLDQDLNPVPAARVSVAGVTLRLDPATVRVTTGAVFTLTITADTGVQAGGTPQPVDSIDAFLDFDATKLRVVDAAGDDVSCTGGAACAGTTAGTALPDILQIKVDNAAGQIAFSVGRGTDDPASGVFDLVTVRFKAVAEVASTSIVFSRAFPRTTDAFFQGGSVLGRLLGGSVATLPPGAPAKLAFTTQPIRGASGYALGYQPVVAVQDIDGNVVTGDSSTEIILTLRNGPVGAALTCVQTAGGVTQRTVVDGAAVFSECSINLSGAGYVLEASAPDLIAAQTAPFNVTLAGDTGGNCRVSMLDFSVVVTHFGKDSNHEDWVAPGIAAYRADLDGDGEVRILDFSIMVTKFFGTTDSCAPPSNGDPFPK